jgi:predicted nucleic acid-binding protein
MTVFLDEVSFTIMRRMGLSKAFTNDGHFRAAGFEPLF